MDELIVFLMREFGWTLEYTQNLAKTLPLKKLNALIAEVKFQKSVDDYQLASNFAMVIANWASAQTKGKRYKVTDFIGQPPNREAPKKYPSLTEVAEKQGIKLPKGGIK